MEQPEHQGVMFDETGEPTPIERRYMPPGPTAFIGEDGGIREFVEARDLDAGVTREIELYGLHTEDARHVERAFRQTRMPMAGSAS